MNDSHWHMGQMTRHIIWASPVHIFFVYLFLFTNICTIFTTTMTQWQTAVTYHLNIQLTPTFSDLLQHSLTFSSHFCFILLSPIPTIGSGILDFFYSYCIVPIRGYCFRLCCVPYITNSATKLFLNFLLPLSYSD